MSEMVRLLDRLALAGIVLSAVFVVASLLYYWDPTRTVFKRLKAKSPYQYEEVDPKLKAVDPASLITGRSPEDIRRALARAVWGADGPPLDRLPVATAMPPCEGKETLACSLDLYPDVAGIERLAYKVSDDYTAVFAHFRPAEGNGRLVVYHHGYAGAYHTQHRHIAALLRSGHGVMAFDFPGYGESALKGAWHKAWWGNWDEVENPMRMFFEPVVAGINHASGEYRTIDMLGLSAGGWTAMVAAALDERIRRSYPVAGGLPVYMRREKETAPPALNPALLAAASYPDMFVAASVGEGRGQLQVFNRYDRCCFAGPRALLYEDAVKKAVGDRGRFRVLLDETHPRHKISAAAMRAILEDMERP